MSHGFGIFTTLFDLKWVFFDVKPYSYKGLTIGNKVGFKQVIVKPKETSYSDDLIYMGKIESI